MKISLKLIAVNGIFALALFLCVGEIWARLSNKGVSTSSNLWPTSYLKGIGWIFEAGKIVSHTNSVDFAIKNKVNSLGFLDKEPISFTNNKSCRTVLIGDSFVEAAQVNIQEKVQSKMITNLISTHPDKGIDVNAFGISGSGQLNNIPIFDKFVAPLDPDVIVLVFVSNDFANNSLLLESIRNNWDPKYPPRLFADVTDKENINLLPLFAPSPETELIKTKKHEAKINTIESLLEFSQFLNYVYSIIKLRSNSLHELYNEYDKRIEFIAKKYPEYSELIWPLYLSTNYYKKLAMNKKSGSYYLDEGFNKPNILPLYENAVLSTSYGLDLFKARALQHNAELIVYAVHSLNDNYLKRLKKMTHALEIPLISQSEYIVDQGIRAQKLNFSFDGHWNDYGHALAAKQITEYINENNLCN